MVLSRLVPAEASHDFSLKETGEASSSGPPSIDNDNVFSCGDWFTNRWSCKGGDWKRNDEASHDRSWGKKYLLNDGYPLCREFAAAINEVLDPWINVRQPRKEIEKQIYNPSLNDRFQRSGKRARFLFDGSEEDYEMEEDILAVLESECWSTVTSDIIECLFDDLCGDATFCKEDYAGSETEIGGWGLLDGLVLARVYYILRADIKSLAYAALTCKHWRSVSKFYKDICRQADLSSVGPNCTDSMICSILDGYNKENITSLVLRGCTNITSQMLGSTWLHKYHLFSFVKDYRTWNSVVLVTLSG